MHGSQLKYDTLGQVILKEEYELGKLITTTADETKQVVEVPPRFPGCENQNLPTEELKKCADKKFHKYIYGSNPYVH